MNIEISEKEAKNLARMVSFAESILGYTNDFIDDPQVATRARVWGKVAQQILQQLHKQGVMDSIEKDHGECHLSEAEFETMMEVQDMFSDLMTHQSVSNELAWRDFHETYSKEEIQQMQKKNQSYFASELHPFEEKYWNEFSTYGFQRLRLSDDKS